MKVEVLAPAGCFTSLRAAIEAGADAIYFGIKGFNMRASAKNFSISELSKVVKICKRHTVKAYLTLNTVLFEDELKEAKKVCNKALKAGVDAIVVCDLGLMTYARSIGLTVHASTQLNISNSEALKFYSQFADTVVLGRESSLENITKISKAIKSKKIKGPSEELVRIEAFVHGAICVSFAGKCYMSLALFNKSANRGECCQPCRRTYKVTDLDSNQELVVDNQYVMSPKDLCTIANLDKLLKAGVSILKIEGRGRSPEYVYTVTKAYKEAVNSIQDGSFTKEKIEQWLKELSSVYNRGFWSGGYYMGEKTDDWANCSGSKATKKKVFVGKITNYFKKTGIAECTVEAHPLKKGDEFLIEGDSTGVIIGVIEELRNCKKQEVAVQGEIVTFPLPQKIKRNDKLYILLN